jgi:antitoxin (DNA-binding transcriptional repressor) of toxin-antitoxin stability system
MQATFKQLRHETGAVIRAVERGEKVTVTYRGRPVAAMSAVVQEIGAAENRLFGIWKDNKAVASVNDYMDSVRKGRVG